MASASVVGQHPGQHFKLPGVGNKLAPTSRQMFRGGAGSGTEQPESPHLPRGPAGEAAAARTAAMRGEGCGASAAPSAPRSPDRGSAEGGTERPGHGVIRDGQPGQSTGDRRGDISCDSNPSSAGRRGASLRKPGVYVMPSEAAGNGHKGAHRHRDALHRRPDPRSGGGGHQLVLPGPALGESGGLPLRRLTQGKTGVVRLARQEYTRREAWTIFPQGEDPRVRAERGEGHRFETKPVAQDWCDVCRRRITAQTLKCQNCSYTCHLECQSQVQLDCNQRDRQLEKTSSPRSKCSVTAAQCKQNQAKEEDERGAKDLPEEEVRTRIEKYNAQITENGMKLAPDGSYTGFIKVHLRLSRPVTVPDVKAKGLEAKGLEATSRHLGSHNQAPLEDQEGMDGLQSEKRTSFYLPCDSVKQLHISSLNTTKEVIQGLLKKFMVLDNPRKFALYRQTHRDGQDLFQKLPLCERPLLLRLIAGPDPQQLSFVLKENETGEVQWHGFSVPELQNFLVILEKEEADRVQVVRQKICYVSKSTTTSPTKT